jgi:hypothetical protein
VALIRGCRLAYVAGLILGLTGILGAHGAYLTEPQATSILKIPVTGGSRKPPVKFSHRVHKAQGVACTQCHHDYQGKRNVWHQGLPVKKCQACHSLRPAARRPDLKNAFHSQCKRCHLKRQQQGLRAGPIKCQFCHRPG